MSMRRREFCGATLAGSAGLALPFSNLLAADNRPRIIADQIAITLSGQRTTLERAALQELSDSLHGSLILPAHPHYDTARRVWNGMIDRRPAMVVMCADAEDVTNAVTFANERKLLLAVRGGGHSFSGQSTCDGGMVISLTSMRSVRVDTKDRIAFVEGGAWGRDVDAATQKQGLATVLGQISDTGVAGLTLGGGFGWLSRRFGLACDNLIAADLVTADGQRRRVSAGEDPDLFWAIRGGGGNFGVATAFEYRLHPVGPRVLAGRMSFPPERRREALQFFAERVPDLPREVSTDVGIWLGEDDKVRAHFNVVYSGELRGTDKALAPLRVFGKGVQDTIAEVDYTVAQQFFDGPSPSPLRHYVKGGFIREFTPVTVDALTELRPGKHFGVYMQDSSGAVGDAAPTVTAFANRKTRVNMMLLAEWPQPQDDDAVLSGVRAAWDELAPLTVGFYVNLSGEADRKNTHSNYGPNYPRLVEIKRKYDPSNLFRLNSNIDPG
jgi:FAD/FMN-containing dehydrogenase